MESIDYRTGMLSGEDNESNQIHQMARIASHWDKSIHRELRRFAQYLWPDTRVLGLIPIHRYRLRKQRESEKIVWWVERDIPPYDHHLCAAYRVELSHAGSDQPQFIVRTGSSVYPIVSMNLEGLQTALVQALTDKPLVIRRRFEPAIDP